MKSILKTIWALIVLSVFIGTLAQWPWHTIAVIVLHSIPMFLIGIVVVPAGAALFVLSVVSISNRPR